MDLKTGNIGKLYLHYLFPSLFSGLVMSIYSLVDMIVVGQYEGPAGTAALACIMPLWTLFCCLSVLFGNGGAVLFSAARGAGKNYDSNLAFTVSFILISSASALVWLAILFFDQPLLKLFGADDTLMPLALQYVRWLKWGIPLWPLGYYLGMFVRNDGSPSLVGIATVCGGVFNFRRFLPDLYLRSGNGGRRHSHRCRSSHSLRHPVGSFFYQKEYGLFCTDHLLRPPDQRNPIHRFLLLYLLCGNGVSYGFI